MSRSKTPSLGELLTLQEELTARIKQLKQGRLVLQRDLDSTHPEFEIVVNENGIDWTVARFYQQPLPGKPHSRVTTEEVMAMYVALCNARGIEPV